MMTGTLRLLTGSLLILCGTTNISAWDDLLPRIDVDRQTVSGTWTKSESAITASANGASRLTLPFQPKSEYDFRVSFTRNNGAHSIALFFATGQGQASFEVDAWGQHLAGIQNINGETIQENDTRVNDVQLENGRRYTAMVEVRSDHIAAYLDGKRLAEMPLTGQRLTVPSIWTIPDTTVLAVGAYASETVFDSIEVRTASDRSLASNANRTGNIGRQNKSQMSRSRQDDRPRVPQTESSSTASMPTDTSAATGKRVLLVIANQDFFYREYIEPRRQFEQAGIKVDVAAGRKTLCRPHSNSGQRGDGSVTPDLAIADANAADYDAIMFSGGWGSSMYQFAFNGSYNNRTYNGDTQTKTAVNRLLNDFVEQGKFIGALCHGVSVLAWARVDGKSLLHNRHVVASPRQSPSGTYNGRRDQPLSRWNAEANRARVSPARSIGNPRTSADDVLVDGKIVTGEDDNSAKLFGATLAKLLTQ
ncbi:DJ-1/PfpI family protein [Rhodopirellula sallentina]|uniref:Cyclic nucleotide-binding protein n=1 Tax=Rhodopirellula sallentina SM41 TaxID=1263870 RepID=M5TRL3_9BACT|nr:DJ-1/PfpI family protein [Rhodopirellula sallentina]EMI51795.1 cyclic nucleotide-binding protein [Rhodopirellula sallentina SM41]